MNQYRVTKFDPKYRVNGACTREDWTSISDIGRCFNGIVLTSDEYETVEKRHCDFLLEMVLRCQAFPLRIECLENYGTKVWVQGQEITQDTLPAIACDVLREKSWCKLVSRDFFIHFGYDYYMYVGCGLTTDEMSALSARYGLFSEDMLSPYYDTEEDC